MLRFWTGTDDYLELDVYRLRLEAARGVRLRRDLSGRTRTLRTKQPLADDRLHLEVLRSRLELSGTGGTRLGDLLETSLKQGSELEVFVAGSGDALRLETVEFDPELPVARPGRQEWRPVELVVLERGSFSDIDDRSSASY